ncbi:hypothetical protein QJS10_CPB04g01015 [Acorus calamus]|uniref:Uncharacterized protein n=1 Tax=Acorus calamus TaxID=4465 RepID=A0AAV9F320_ACOCL|nr:hypothetical protein QJS10_CPB04g01015 [Acorus calamus]
MSEYDYVVVGKLKLKGKALNVKAGGMKKKKKSKHHYDQILSQEGTKDDNHFMMTISLRQRGDTLSRRQKSNFAGWLRPPNKSHRDRIQELTNTWRTSASTTTFPKLVQAN